MKSKTDQVFDLLRHYESRNVTFLDPRNGWPIVWDRAKGVHVWDAEGQRYLDLTAAFGVAAAGHANPRIVRTGQQQMARLLHAMGDVHPHTLKAQLARELSRITFERWGAAELQVASCRLQVAGSSVPPTSQSEVRSCGGKTIFCNSGFEAVEAALKTAALATGKRDVIAFQGAYHGLGYGTLNVTHREHFRSAFRAQLRQFGCFLPFPNKLENLKPLEEILWKQIRKGNIGAVLVEPIQARGGINIPPREFLPLLRRVCNEAKALLIVDEVYTGFGRTGRWFACEHSVTIPDIICLGKALTGGFPLSACVGRADWMDRAWPPSSGEAIHTSTFLGHPVGCAMALAQIREIKERRLIRHSAELGEFLSEQLRTLQTPSAQLAARGIGLMAGLELRLRNGKPATDLCLKLIRQMLRAGFVLLPEGEHAQVISFTPPLIISKKQLERTLSTLKRFLAKL